MRSSAKRAENVFRSFFYAFAGLKAAFTEERNFRVQSLYGLLVLLTLTCLGVELWKAAVVLASVLCLLAAELANSSLERLTDLVSPDFHPMAGQAKDMAAAGVMLVSFASALLFLGVVWSHLKPLETAPLALLSFFSLSLSSYERDAV